MSTYIIIAAIIIPEIYIIYRWEKHCQLKQLNAEYKRLCEKSDV
jgi:hypothetical protein